MLPTFSRRSASRSTCRSTLRGAINEAGVGFLWAPLHHSALKHWAPIRGELGIRTIFNLLGPICNPAGVKRQVVGVFSAHWVEPIAHVLKNLGCEHVWVVHGHDGLDELTTTGATEVAEVKDGKVPCSRSRRPMPASPPPSSPTSRAAMPSTTPLPSARCWPGRRPLRDIALLNAAAALIVADKAASLTEGAALAARAIELRRRQGRAGPADRDHQRALAVLPG